jgi:hypothetical protein
VLPLAIYERYVKSDKRSIAATPWMWINRLRCDECHISPARLCEWNGPDQQGATWDRDRPTGENRADNDSFSPSGRHRVEILWRRRVEYES